MTVTGFSTMYVFIGIVSFFLSVNGQVGGIVISLRGLGNVQGVSTALMPDYLFVQ